MAEVLKSLSQNLHDRLGFFHSILKLENSSIFLLWLFTISSLIGISLGYADWFISKTPINLMLGFLLVLINIPFGKTYGKPLFFFIFLFGMAIEIIGVSRGDVFGVYYYGENLGFKVSGVPLMIGIYWAVLTTVTSQIARIFFDKLILVATTGALLMVGLDFLMEQMAGNFDFWHFSGGIAPLQNYITWFLASFFLHVLAFKIFPKGGSLFASHLYLNQILFFIFTYMLIQL